MIVLAGLAAAATAGVLIADGGPLRERINLMRDPSRQRGEHGSATFCLPRQFQHLSRRTPGGLIL